jgi:6-pyruvoyltetrahydropterin/6-carboxytetrahydropterin synthase
MGSVTVRHNMEVAHRLTLTPGKCQNIHGHSMWVELTITGQPDSTGKLGGLDFAVIKSLFRAHLDVTYDHHLVLNAADPWATLLAAPRIPTEPQVLPGLVTFPGDPTIENLAARIHEWAVEAFGRQCSVRVQETATNSATAP